MAEIANLVVRYSADTKSAEAGADRVNSSIGKVTKAGAALAIAGGALLGGFFAKSAMGAANFEQGMSGVAASLGGVGVTGGITEAQFQSLSDEALRIGQTTSVGATDAARAMDLLAKAGVPVESIYNGVAQGVVNVSEATGESLDNSSAAYGTFQNMFKDTGISAEQMSDTIVNAMNASNMSLPEFQTGIARLAPVIAGTGMSFQDSSAAIAYFNAQGFSAAEVGTSLTAAYTSLVAPTEAQAAAQQAMGIAAFDAQGQFVGFPAIMDQVQAATEGMTDAQRAETIATLFGADARDIMTLATKDGGKPLADYIKLMNKSGTAATASATRMDNLKGDIEGLKGALETLSIKVGSALLPALRGLTQGLTGLIVGATEFGEKFIQMMNPAADFGTWLQSMPGWAQPVIKALAGLYQAGGDVVDAFQDFKKGDFAGGFRELGEAARTAWRALSDLAATAFDWVLDTGVPAVTGWLVDHAGDIWGGIKTLVGVTFDGITAAISWTASVGIPSVIGGITSIAGRAGDWLRGMLVGGLSTVGDGTGGPDPTGANGSISALLGAWTINVGVPAIVGAITSIAGRLGDWLRDYLYGGSAYAPNGFHGMGGGAGGGITVDIAQITLNVLDAVADFDATDVQGWLQDRMDELGTVKAELHEWRVILTEDPKVEGDPKGNSEKSIADILGQSILYVPILGWAIQSTSNPDLLFDPLKKANDALQAVFKRGQIKLNDIKWAIQLANPATLFPAAMNLALDIKNKLPSISVSGIKWALGLSLPDINLPSGDAIKAAIRVAGEAAGIPGWILDRIVGGASPTPAMRWGEPFGDAPRSGQGSETTSVTNGAPITTLPNTGGKSVFDQVQGMAQQVAAAMTQLAASVRSGVAAATAALNPLGTGFTATGARVTAATTQMAAQVRAQVTAMVAQVRAQFTQLQSTTAATMTAMQSQVNAQFSQMVSQGTAQVNALRAAVQSGMQAMSAAGNAAMAQFSNAVRSGFQQAVSAAQAGVSGIRGAVNSIGSLYGQGASIGASLGQGIAAGIQGQIGAVASAAASLVSAALAAARNAGAIASPSKKTRDLVGVPLVQGVIVGMESQRDALNRTFASMIPVDARLGRGYSPHGISGGRYASGQAPVEVHNHYYQVVPEKLVTIMKQAQNGDRAYQQQQPRSRELQLGSSR